MSNEAKPPGMLLVLSGPAGVGKDSVWQHAGPCLPSFAKAITCTTRAPRPGETHGVDYYFASNHDFDGMIERDELLEWAEVHGNRYGVPVSSVTGRLNAGGDVICIIEVQGALRIRALFPESTLVFLKPPPGREEQILRERMAGRGAETAEETARRMQTAEWELGQTSFYDYQIINDEIENAAQQLCDIVAQKKADHTQPAGTQAVADEATTIGATTAGTMTTGTMTDGAI